MSKCRNIFRKVRRFFIHDIYVEVQSTDPFQVLDGKTVVITGGSRGIGYAIAEKCLEQGAKVIITGNDIKKLESACDKLKNNKTTEGYIYECQWNIADVGICESKIEEILHMANGTIDCWVNNAGIYKAVDYANCKETDWDMIFSTNAKGLYFATNRIVQYFLKNQKAGNIVNISSQAGETASTTPYAFTKNIIEQYTRGLAYELSKKHIRINAVAPGAVATEINGCKPDEVINYSAIGGRFLIPEEVAEVVIFLLSDLSKCINGEIITLNEGNTLKVEYNR